MPILYKKNTIRLGTPLLALWMVACPPLAQPVVEDTITREVSVSATARINVAPDEALINLTFASTASNMRKSHAASTHAVDTFTTAMSEMGIPKDAIELCGTTDGANHRWDGSNRVISYTSTTILNVHMKDFEKVADIVDTAVASGASNIQVDYRSTTMPEHKKKARELAIVAAREKATQLAVGTDAKLGQVLKISEGTFLSGASYHNFGNVVQTEMREMSDDNSPITPGTTPLELTIQATFALE